MGADSRKLPARYIKRGWFLSALLSLPSWKCGALNQ